VIRDLVADLEFVDVFGLDVRIVEADYGDALVVKFVN
jgi:hypothetical protein